MLNQCMGRNEALITADAAARILGIGRRQVYRMHREELLRAVVGKGRQMMFYADEIQGLLESRQKNLTLPQLHRAVLAERVVRLGLERRLERLERMLFIRSPAISNDEAEVVALIERTCGAAKKPPTELIEILDWCAILFSVQEETFHLIEVHTNNPEPWAPFLLLAERMYEYCQQRLYDEEFKDAYTELTAARRSVRQAAFFYIMKSRSREYAQGVIVEAETSVLHRVNRHVR